MKENSKELSLKEWEEIKLYGGYIFSCSCPICSLTTDILYDNTGVVRDQSSYPPQFIMLNSFTTQIKRYKNDRREDSIANIWGCQTCKTLTYTNCIVSYAHLSNYKGEYKVIKVE